MPIVVMPSGGACNLQSSRQTPPSYIALAVCTMLFLNPLFGDVSSIIPIMPVVVMQGSGITTVSGTNQGPQSHICLAIFVLLCVNPPFGLVAVCFAVASRMAAPLDWEGARMKGKISMFISITGIVISIIAVLAFILIFYTKDT